MRILSFLSIWFMFIGIVICQPINKFINDVVLPTPNEAALGKYLDIPVNPYTGTTSITVPIHTLGQGSLVSAISMSYHGGGIKAEEMSSRVGLGWHLSAGGSVTRIVNGYPDDDASSGIKGFYHHGSELMSYSSKELEEMVSGTRDGEPDVYSFSCGGYSGQFFFKKNKEIVLVPEQDVVIKPINDNSTNYFDGFIIITPDGVRHHLGTYNGTDAYTITHPGGGSEYISTWHLVRTETYDGLHHISYSYEDDLYSYSSNASCRAMTLSCQSIYSSLHNYSGTSSTNGVDCGGAPEISYGTARFAYRLTNVEGKRLLQINTDDEVVRFISITDREDLYTYDNTIVDQKKALDEIQIETGTFCKSFRMDYEYFIDPAHVTAGPIAAAASKRLKLKSVTEKSCNGMELPPYQFTYDETRSLPWRHTKAIDHWGYNNGAINNDFNYVNVPQIVTSGTAYGASDRESSEAHMLTGSLTSVSYPTGGTTDITYEAHRVVDDVISNQILFDTTSCITPTPSCCSAVGTKVTKGISLTGSQVTDLYADLTIEIPYTEFTCDSGNTATAELIIYELAAPSNVEVYRRSISMAVSSAPGRESFTFDIADSTLAPSTLYSIELIATNGWGKLNLYQQTIQSGDRIVGGLRVQKITQSDAISSTNDIVKTYTYLNAQDESSALLLYEPQYAYSSQAQQVEINGDPSTYTFDNAQAFVVLMFSTSSFVPMSSFDNNHIGYKRVTEHHNGNGSKIYSYKSIAPYPILTYPAQPVPYRADNGTLEEEEIYVEGAMTPISTQLYERATETFFQSSSSLRRISERFTCGLPGFGGFAFMSSYTLPTEAYRVGRTTFTLDQVTTITDTDYDSAQRFTAAISTTMTNSDGKKHHTQYLYPHDVSGAVYDSLESLNIITPIETIQSVGADINTATVVDGSKTLYSFFTTANGLYPYPQSHQRREVTWDDHTTYQDGGYVTQGTIVGYDSATGFPSSVLMRGWPQTLNYTWNGNGTLSVKEYAGDSTSYSYHLNTKLLSGMTAVDGTSSSYTWDKLMRLKTITDPKGIVTTMDYNYGSGADQNHIVQTSNFPTLGALTNHDITTIKFVDGLGRGIQSLAFNQHPVTGSIATQISYDPYGRVNFTHEPKLSAGGSGSYSAVSSDYTETTYEPSPLNRASSTTPPLWSATSISYGSNTAAEVYNHQSGTYYAANTLSKQSVTDPEQQVTETYTDKRGRVILSRVKKNNTTTNPTEIADTYTVYDDKDRPIIVLPPQTTLSDANLIFKKYYSQDDLVIKKADPDCDPVDMIYDNRDLLTHRQDGERKIEGKWYSYTYDDYGQITHEGFTTSSTATINDTLISNSYGDTGIERRKLLTSSSTILNSDTDLSIVQAYEYDNVGRVIVSRSNSILHPELASIVDSMIYDSGDNIIESYQKIIPDQITIKNRYTYDHASRLKKSFIQLTTPDPTQANGLMQWPEQELSEQNYNEKELVLKTTLGGGLQEINYSYLPNRFLSSINNPDIMGTDLFAMKLGYDTNISDGLISGEIGLEDGNISHTTWRSAGENIQAYQYNYDFLKRLKDANYFQTNNNGKYTTHYTYEDHRGNFNTLSRMSPDGMIDDLLYDYHPGTNTIKSITDGVTVASQKGKGYKGNTTNDYIQNQNGFITHDAETGATLGRDHNNLLASVQIDSTVNIVNLRDANGLLHRRLIDSAGYMTIVDKIGSIEFRNGAFSTIHHPNGYITTERGVTEDLRISDTMTHTMIEQGVAITSDRVLLSGADEENTGQEFVHLIRGFIVENGAEYLADIDTFEVQGLNYHYTIKDHLGSPRAIFKDANNTATLIVIKNYYPFGLEWEDTSTEGVPNYRQSYNDKEAISFTNYLEFEARGYIKSINLFDGPDPISDQFPHVATNNYAELSPVANIDLWGLQAEDASFPNQQVQDGVQKIADGITALINFARSIFTEGNAEGGSGNGTPMTTDQGITVLTNSDKNSAGSNPAPDGEGSTVVIEDGELLLPKHSLLGSASTEAGGAVNAMDKLGKAASDLSEALDLNFEDKPNIKSEIPNPYGGIKSAGDIDTVTLNGKKFQRIVIHNRTDRKAVKLKPIKE